MADQDRWNENRRYGRPAPRAGYERSDDDYGEYSTGGSPGEGRRGERDRSEPRHDNRYAPFGAGGPVRGAHVTYDDNGEPYGSGWGQIDYDRDPRRYGRHGRSADYQPASYERGRGERQGSDDRFEERAREVGREARTWWDKATDKVSSLLGDDDGRDRDRYDAAAQGYVGGHRGRGPKGYRRSDERIREDVSDRLTDDPFLDASDIEVSVANSEVTLSGTIRRREDKRRAENLAEAISGVTHVQNNLRMGPDAGQGRADTTGAGL